MYICNENVKILSELPRWRKGMREGKIDRESMVGMVLSVEYYGKIYNGIKIIDYYKNNNGKFRFKIEYKNQVKDIDASSFLLGNLKNIIIDHFVDKNNKYVDEDNVVHIFITNKSNKKFEALYSGEYIDEVLYTNWSITLNKSYQPHAVRTANYNSTGKSISLHQVDLGSWVDHINNDPLDNRIENLRKTTPSDNSKNLNTNNKWGLTGLRKQGNSWISAFSYNNHSIFTKPQKDLKEAKIDNLIAQRHLDYKHNEDMFYLLDDLPIKRIKCVVDLLEKKKVYFDNKKREEKYYEYNIVKQGDYYKLLKQGEEMLFDCNPKQIEKMCLCKNNAVGGYWSCTFVENGDKIRTKFHREIMGLRPNDYSEYNLHVDHLNNNPDDNRFCNLVITTHYGNQCNKKSLGYGKRSDSNLYIVRYMKNYRFFELIGGLRVPSFKTEEEAIEEVARRRKIVDEHRVKLKSIDELDNLIEYCLNNGYLLEGGLADLDLGYLYWKEKDK